MTLVVVGGLGGIGVADELGIEINRMIGLAEREAKVVDGEDVFEQLRAAVVADAARLAGGVERVGESVGAEVEVMVVGGIFDADAPEDDGGVVPVATYHAADVVNRKLLPWFRTNLLPARDFFKDEQADRVAAIEEVPRLRVVGGSDDVAMEARAQVDSVIKAHT